MKMIKKCMIVLTFVVLMVSVVSAANPAIQAIDLCNFPVYMDIGYYIQLPEYNNCMSPVYTDVGYYVELKDCNLHRLNLSQVDCESIGKDAGDFPCFAGCENIEVRANFPAILGAKLRKIGPVLMNTAVFWKDYTNQINGVGDWETLTICMNAWKVVDPVDKMLVGDITITTTVPATLSGWIYMPPDVPDIGYSLNEDNLIYYYSSEPVWYYNFTTGLWDTDGPVSWIYVDWPFIYESDTDTYWFAYPPVDGLWVYHFSTDQWEQLPQIIP